MSLWKKILFAALGVLAIGMCVYFVFFAGRENRPKMIENVTIVKTASPARTVSVGGKITYTITVKNGNEKKCRLEIEDTLPENTVFVSGDAVPKKGKITFSVAPAAGEEKSVSYTVRLSEVYKEGDVVKAPAATIGKKASEATENYVARTFDASEQKRMRDGILALMYSEEITPIKLIRDMYLVAFSEAPAFSADLTPDELSDLIFALISENPEAQEKLRATVVPKMYGGSAVDTALDVFFVGERSLVKESDLFVGDILLISAEEQTNIYIYDGKALISVMDGCGIADANSVLSSIENAERYALLRPSMTLATLRYAAPADDEELSEAQSALIATAMAYLQRGYRAQYDDSRLAGVVPSVTIGDGGSEYRWQLGQYNPEDYTAQKWGYLNCAAFTYECYRTALGMDLGNRYTTRNLVAHYTSGGAIGASEYPYSYSTRLNVPEEERVAEQEKFMNALEPGDLVVIIRKGGYGHVMLYIGDGVLIHSSGASFNYSKDQETYEPTIRYMNVLGYLFDPDSTNYLFREVEDEDTGNPRCYIYSLGIVRPLDSFKGEIPENTLNRMQNLSDIYSEKLSSHPEGKTASVGEKITFTFRVENRGETAKTLEVLDTVPAGTLLFSAGDFTVQDGSLRASVTVLPGESKSVSYAVTVIGASGEQIHATTATVGGVLHACPSIRIGETLTEAQQAAVLQAIEKFKAQNAEGLVNFDLVNAIYREAGLGTPFTDDVRASLFASDNAKDGGVYYTLNEESEYYSMVVPTLYGGRRFFTPQRYSAYSKTNTDRSRLPREQALTVGDVLVVKFGSSEAIYMYAGSLGLLNLSETNLAKDAYSTSVRLMRMISVGNYYAVLRPSLY